MEALAKKFSIRLKTKNMSDFVFPKNMNFFSGWFSKLSSGTPKFEFPILSGVFYTLERFFDVSGGFSILSGGLGRFLVGPLAKASKLCGQFASVCPFSSSAVSYYSYRVNLCQLG